MASEVISSVVHFSLFMVVLALYYVLGWLLVTRNRYDPDPLIWITLHLYGVGRSDGRRPRRTTSAGSLRTFVVNLVANIGAIVVSKPLCQLKKRFKLKPPSDGARKERADFV